MDIYVHPNEFLKTTRAILLISAGQRAGSLLARGYQDFPGLDGKGVDEFHLLASGGDHRAIRD